MRFSDSGSGSSAAPPDPAASAAPPESDSPRLVDAETWRRMVGTIFDVAEVGLCVTDRHCRIVATNRAWLQIYGWTAEEVVGQPFTIVVPPEARAAARDLHDLFIQRRLTELPSEWDVVAKTGRPVRVLVTAERFLGPEGEPYKVTTVADITRRQQVELALAESEARFRSLLECSVDWFWECDAALKLVFVSDRARHASGLDPEELAGMALPSLAADEVSLQRLRAALSGSEPFRDLAIRLDPRSAGREVRRLRLSAVPIGPDGGWRGVARDVTLDDEASARADRAQRLQELGRMAGSLAYDLNNMLQPLLNYLYLAQSEPEHVSEALRMALRLRDYSTAVLGLSRGGGAGMDGPPIAELVERLPGLLAALARDGITIEVQALKPEAAPVTLPVSEATLMRLLLNLVRNAVDACKPGDRIQVGFQVQHLQDGRAQRLALAEGPYLQLSVSDTGSGMSPDVLERIFNPFFTTKPLGAGTGLGLAGVHLEMHAIGGAVAVDSRPGTGSRFDLYFPLKRRLPLPPVP